MNLDIKVIIVLVTFYTLGQGWVTDSWPVTLPTMTDQAVSHRLEALEEQQVVKHAETIQTRDGILPILGTNRPIVCQNMITNDGLVGEILHKDLRIT